MAPLYVRSNARVLAPRAAVAATSKAACALPFGLPTPDPQIAQLPAGISLCMIVKNEERFLEACLRSVVGHVDEICIVDTGSTDRTVEIALGFGARVEHRAWQHNFAWARNEALALATRRWILVLDADEELDSASHAVLQMMRTLPAALTGLFVRCNNLSDDYKGTGISSHAIVRFVPNNPRVRYVSPIHEYIAIDGKTTGIDARVCPLSITHHGYLSEIVKLRNKSERNLALVKAAAEDEPDEPFNWYNLGTTSILCGDSRTAIAAFEKMRIMVGTTLRGFIPNALAQLADLYADRGDHDLAVAAANESLRKSPHFANAHFALGRALAKAKRFPEARAAFEAAIADAPYSDRQFIVDDEVSVWKAHSEIGGTYGQEGNDLAALDWFERALQHRPKLVPVRMNRAKALERLGRFNEAEAVYKGLADDEPGDAHSVDYINYLLRRNDYVATLRAIDDVLAVVTPRTHAALLVTAAKLVEQTGTGDVQTLLERAIRAFPGAADALDALEALYESRGDRLAVEALRHAELDAPMELALDFVRRSTRHIAAGRFVEAENVARAGLAVAPNDPALHYNLGAVLVQTGHKESALIELEQAGVAGDVGLRAMFLRAIVLSDVGRYADALDAVDAVITIAPNEVDPRLQRFRFAQALGRDAEAEATLREALTLGDSRVAAELATWLLQKGRFVDAQAVAEAALEFA